MSKYNRPCRLKKEARPFFKEDLAERTLSYDQWHNYYHMDENALEEVEEVYITYGAKRYSKYSTSGTTNDLGGWANPDNDEYKKNGQAGGRFCFTIHFPSMKWEEHDKFSRGRLIAGLIDRIQKEADWYFKQFASGEIDDLGNEKKK